MARVTLVISDISDYVVDTKIYIEGTEEEKEDLYESDSPAVFIAMVALEAIREELKDGGEIITGADLIGEADEVPVYSDNVLEFPEHKTLN